MVFIKNIENKMDSSISVFDIKKQSPIYLQTVTDFLKKSRKNHFEGVQRFLHV